MQGKNPKSELPPLPWWISYYRSFTFGVAMMGVGMLTAGRGSGENPSTLGLISCIVGTFCLFFGLSEQFKSQDRIVEEYYKTLKKD